MHERIIPMKPLLALCALTLLAGCAPQIVGSVIGGECKLTHTPEYAVKGQTAYDQRWINNTVEAQVVGCKQPRPKKRPAGWSTHTVGGKTVPVPPPEVSPVNEPSPAPLKPRLRDRLLHPFRG
jgi:hypothetical protein